jgi:hypothetical protein
MKSLSILTQLLFLVLITQSCSNSEILKTENKIKDTINIPANRYHALLEAYQTQILSNDTVYLGFRIGMSLNDVENRVALLTERGIVTRSGNKLFSYIASNESTENDKDSVHQFVVELLLGVDDEEGILKGINANIYAPRFLLTSSNQKRSDENNPAYNAYKEIVGDSMAQANQQNKIANSSKRIKRFIEEHLLSSYRLKYGAENHKIETPSNSTQHIWVSNGRWIELDIDQDYNLITKKLLDRKAQLSKENFSQLIYVASVSYYKVSDKLIFSNAIDKGATEFQIKSDSLMKKQLERENKLSNERVEKSGI